jgi:L-glyceraldehyde 3-phosphate reductase
MALAWVLRNPVITSVLIGASRWSQIEECLGALRNLRFSGDELQRIDQHAIDGGLNIWAASSQSG